MNEVRRVQTLGGYVINSAALPELHAIDKTTGVWRTASDHSITTGDILALPLGRMHEETRAVPLPVLDQLYYAGDQQVRVPDELSPELAELVGYFMGDGSLHAKGIRLCVANTDPDVVDRLTISTRELFRIEPSVRPCQGYREVTLQSVRLARWWRAAGFAKALPAQNHVGKGWTPSVPAAVLESNNCEIYSAFVRGLFEADGTVLESVPSFSTSSDQFADEVRRLLLALGLITTTRVTTSGYGSRISQVRLRNLDHAVRFLRTVGFVSQRKTALLSRARCRQSGNRDRIYVPRAVWDEIVPIGHDCRRMVISALAKSGGVSRQTATRIASVTPDRRLTAALGYAFEHVVAIVGPGERGTTQVPESDPAPPPAWP